MIVGIEESFRSHDLALPRVRGTDLRFDFMATQAVSLTSISAASGRSYCLRGSVPAWSRCV